MTTFQKTLCHLTGAICRHVGFSNLHVRSFRTTSSRLSKPAEAVAGSGDAQDIYVDDLEATLEAHRTTNRAKIIRHIKVSENPTVRHLPLEISNSHLDNNASDDPAVKHAQSAISEYHVDDVGCDAAGPLSHDAGKSRTAGTTAEKEAASLANDPLKPWDFWPVGSEQHQRLTGKEKKAPKGAVLEYHARAINPIGTWKPPSVKDASAKLFRPWRRHMDEQGGDASQRVAAQVKRIVISKLKDVTCEMVGSYSTGLAMPYSDIDFAVLLPDNVKGKRNKGYIRALRKLQLAFDQDRNFNSKSELVYARIPILRATHQVTGQEVQIQISRSASQQQEYTSAYLAEFPTLRALYLVIRSCLELRRLNITYEGGLGSYGTLMLIVNALKRATGRYDHHDVGSQLLYVLDFYANSDLYRSGFSVEPPRTFLKGKLKGQESSIASSGATDPVLRGIEYIAKIKPQQPYLLCLQDPADPSNDLGRKAWMIKHIQATFALVRNKMMSDMEVWDRGSNGSATNGTKTAFLDTLIYGNYHKFMSDRRKIEVYGAVQYHVGGTHEQGHLNSNGKISAQEMLKKVIKVDQQKAAEKLVRKH
ncbi:MAG: hypothetical protein Q9219_005323 [cf. Caloplaca sp. 3 TL-2023]